MIQKLILCDCLDAVRDISDGSLDCLITSPPYTGVGKDYDESIDYEVFINTFSPKIKTDGLFIWQTGTTVKNGFINFLDIEINPYFLKNGFQMVNRVVWHFGRGLHCKNRFSGRYETISIYARNKNHTFNLDSVRIPSKYPDKKHYKGPKKGLLSGNPLGKNPSDVWEITNIKHNHPEKTGHPAQFPEELVKRLVLAFTNENDIVVDPFSGSGTVGKVCQDLNRQFIGIEKDEKYFNIAKERLGL